MITSDKMTAPKPRVGRPPRAKKAAEFKPSVRISKTENSVWRLFAGYQPLGDWMRDQCNRAVVEAFGDALLEFAAKHNIVNPIDAVPAFLDTREGQRLKAAYDAKRALGVKS